MNTNRNRPSKAARIVSNIITGALFLMILAIIAALTWRLVAWILG